MQCNEIRIDRYLLYYQGGPALQCKTLVLDILGA
jgi:hypothetical protein